MPGRKFDAGSGYRYGFGGQEKDIEINENLYTAQNWEYDSRIGRRWNLDQKPTIGVSEYSSFGNNPIFYIDPLGDTTYIYNQRGILKEVILDNLKTNEIVFMMDQQIANMMKIRNKYSDDKIAIAARHKANNIARITSTTIDGLLANWTNSISENGGIVFPSVTNDNQLNFTICSECKVEDTKFGGELNSVALSKHSKEKAKDVLVLGYWHSHKEDGVPGTQPSSSYGQDLDIGLDVKELEKGGIGIIVNKNSITIFPLNESGKNNQDVSQNNNKTKLFNQKYIEKDNQGNKREGTKKYPSFNRNVTPVKK